MRWIAGMGKAHARLDAYAHNPLIRSARARRRRPEAATTAKITLATLPRLINAVDRAFGTRTRIWLTEYGYQTNPPDRLLGVSSAKQARYVSEAALVAFQTPLRRPPDPLPRRGRAGARPVAERHLHIGRYREALAPVISLPAQRAFTHRSHPAPFCAGQVRPGDMVTTAFFATTAAAGFGSATTTGRARGAT